MSHRQFLRALLVGVVAAFAAATIVGPPDPLTQIRLVALALLVAVPLAALLAYGGGYDWLRARLRS